jgi:hypothetical protein
MQTRELARELACRQDASLRLTRLLRGGGGVFGCDLCEDRLVPTPRDLATDIARGALPVDAEIWREQRAVKAVFVDRSGGEEETADAFPEQPTHFLERIELKPGAREGAREGGAGHERGEGRGEKEGTSRHRRSRA